MSYGGCGERAREGGGLRERRERGRSSPCGTHGGPRRLSSSRDVTGVEGDRRQPEMGTRTNGGSGASRFQRRAPVEGVKPGEAHRQGQRARGRRWPRGRARHGGDRVGLLSRTKEWERERRRGRRGFGAWVEVGGEEVEASRGGVDLILLVDGEVVLPRPVGGTGGRRASGSWADQAG